LQFLRVAHCTETGRGLSIANVPIPGARPLPRQPKRKTPRKDGKAYKHPIPGPNELLDVLESLGKPVRADAILAALGLKGQRMRAMLVDRLYGMVRSGQVLQNRKEEYCLTAKLDLVTGTVTGHRDGFGFVVRDDGDKDDIFLSAREMRPLFDGDRVAVRVVGADRRGRAEGELVEVLERGPREIAGQYLRERGIGLVIPDNPRIAHRILVPKDEAGAATAGDMVVLRILDYPTQVQQATGRIVKVIGRPDAKGIATDIAIHSHALPHEWPSAVLEEIAQFGSAVPAPAKRGRKDLRQLDLVTIDGEDARDFDDAVYCERAGSGWRLIVAIADVSHYVDAGTALDKEATRRGTSVYFPDRVIPMLPEVLSNGLCSLNPKVDRLCMVCEMRVSADGKVTRSEFYEGVMRSKARLTYTAVNSLFEGKPVDALPGELHGRLQELHELYQVLLKARSRRGAIEIDLPQTRFRLDAAGTVQQIEVVVRNDAHRLIEECMIAANVQAAKFLRRHKIQGLYRVHAKPDPDKFDELRMYLVSLGLKVAHPHHVEPRHFSQIARQVANRHDAPAITMAMLRSLPHAEYTPQNIGHFGLALDAYAHFTSPIRRYPDLLVHRAIRHIVRGGKPGTYRYNAREMERLGMVTSAHERRAEEATREVEAWLRCQYMEAHVGGEFDGVITGVTNFGLFVQIESLLVDGLVHVTSLANDYYHYEAGAQRMVGERTGRSYRLGESMRVQVQRVDMETRRIDFRPVEQRRA